MQREMMKSKLHGVTVTGCFLDYMGSLAIDENLLDESDILANEKVQVVNLANGERFETYAITAPRGSLRIELNGGAALKAKVGDQILVITYARMEEEECRNHVPRVLVFEKGDNGRFKSL